MKFVLVVVFILSFFHLSAQDTLIGRVDGYPRREVIVCQQFGDESKVVGTVKTDLNGGFGFTFSNQPVGLYRVYLDSEDFFDLIYNNESIEIKTKVENPQYNMVVLKSEENSQLYSYIVQNYVYDYKIDVLRQMTDIYPDGNFRDRVEKELYKEIKLKNNNLDKVIKQNEESFCGKYLVYFKEISVPKKLNEYERIEFLKENYFEHYSMKDVAMLNSNAYTTLVLNYFKLFKSNNPEIYYTAGKAILENVFFEDPKIVSYVFEYILSGFESLGLDEPAAKLSLEYGNVCSEGDETLKMRIKSNTELKIGSKAPEITRTTISGKNFNLSDMKSEYTLIIFWATWCEHCQVTMPRLAAAENIFKEADMNIVSVSIDSEEAELVDFLNNNPMPWETICDFKGWDGSVVIDYAIYATPSMYVVDKNMNIIAKPFNEEKLYEVLEMILTK